MIQLAHFETTQLEAKIIINMSDKRSPWISIVVGYYLANVICLGFVDQALRQTSLSSQDQQELLNAHNHYRSIVSPSASNMERMVSVWSIERHLFSTSCTHTVIVTQLATCTCDIKITHD